VFDVDVQFLTCFPKLHCWSTFFASKHFLQVGIPLVWLVGKVKKKSGAHFHEHESRNDDTMTELKGKTWLQGKPTVIILFSITYDLPESSTQKNNTRNFKKKHWWNV